jgi:hypothetical protein
MSNPSNLLLSSVSLLRLASILFALWLASRFEPRVAALVQGEDASPPGAGLRTLIWLAIGSIFAIPLFDLVTVLHEVVELYAPATWGLADGTMTTLWGAASPRVFDALSAGTTIAVYAVASRLLWRSFRGEPLGAIDRIARSAFDRILLTLALAGLVNLIVTSLVVGVVFVQWPTAVGPLGLGAFGLIVPWFVGLLLALALALWINMRVQPDDD